jgi:hypothetical protein
VAEIDDLLPIVGAGDDGAEGDEDDIEQPVGGAAADAEVLEGAEVSGAGQREGDDDITILRDRVIREESYGWRLRTSLTPGLSRPSRCPRRPEVPTAYARRG